MNSEILTEENFLLYAARHYDNILCTDVEEFYDDLKRFKYIKRLLGKYKESGELKERLILNHLIILYNVFGDSATKMLFLKLSGFHSELKPFVLFLGFLPEIIRGIKPDPFYTSDISMDPYIVSVLRKI